MRRLFILLLSFLLFALTMPAWTDAQSSDLDDLCPIEQIWLGDLETDPHVQFMCRLACEIQIEGYAAADLCQALADYGSDELADLCLPCDAMTETEGDAQ